MPTSAMPDNGRDLYGLTLQAERTMESDDESNVYHLIRQAERAMGLQPVPLTRVVQTTPDMSCPSLPSRNSRAVLVDGHQLPEIQHSNKTQLTATTGNNLAASIARSTMPGGPLPTQLAYIDASCSIDILRALIWVIFRSSRLLVELPAHFPNPRPELLSALGYLIRSLQAVPLSSRRYHVHGLSLMFLLDALPMAIGKMSGLHGRAIERCVCVALLPQDLCDCYLWRTFLDGLESIGQLLTEMAMEVFIVEKE